MGGGASVQKRDLLFPYPYSISSIQNYIIPRRVRGPTMGTSAPGCPNNPGEFPHVDIHLLNPGEVGATMALDRFLGAFSDA